MRWFICEAYSCFLLARRRNSDVCRSFLSKMGVARCFGASLLALFGQSMIRGRREIVRLSIREDAPRSFLYTIHATPLRSLVPAPGTRRWQWGMVVSILADESWSRRVPGKSA